MTQKNARCFHSVRFVMESQITQRGRRSTCARSAPEPCWSSRSREVAVPATSGERKETTKDFFVLDLSEVELLSFPLGDKVVNIVPFIQEAQERAEELEAKKAEEAKGDKAVGL